MVQKLYAAQYPILFFAAWVCRADETGVPGESSGVTGGAGPLQGSDWSVSYTTCLVCVFMHLLIFCLLINVYIGLRVCYSIRNSTFNLYMYMYTIIVMCH